MRIPVDDWQGTARLAHTPTYAGLWRAGLYTAGMAAVANLAILGAANASGVDHLVRTQPGAPLMPVSATHVLVSTVLAMVAGLGMTHLAQQRWNGATRWMQIIGGVIAVLSVAMPFGAAEAAAGTRLTLAAMHLVTGAAFVVALGRARRA